LKASPTVWGTFRFIASIAPGTFIAFSETRWSPRSAAASIDYLIVDPPDQGMHLAAYTRNGLSDVTIEKLARDYGVIVRAMSRLYFEAPKQSALILGFSGYPRQMIAPAIVRLARAFE
jgi:DNA-binding transcriptional MocR family regulator